ncbi:hypothetical protein E4U59_003212 [Claviceps monticola]|nr:hypothetical protein E4U59_003212 [Claviceps monticola]
MAVSTNEKTAFPRVKGLDSGALYQYDDLRSLFSLQPLESTQSGSPNYYRGRASPSTGNEWPTLVSHLSREGFKAFKDDNNHRTKLSDHRTKLSDQWKNEYRKYEMERRNIHHLTLLINNETLRARKGRVVTFRETSFPGPGENSWVTTAFGAEAA